jgi:hypothetical protein
MKRWLRYRVALSALLGLIIPGAGQMAAAADSGTIRVTEPPRQFRSGPSVHGPITVTYEPSMMRMKAVLCPSFRFSTGILFGCANIETGRGCAITLWSGLKRTPALRAAIEAHERAHCRGWGADHAGAIVRSYHVGKSFFAAAHEESNAHTAER